MKPLLSSACLSFPAGGPVRAACTTAGRGRGSGTGGRWLGGVANCSSTKWRSMQPHCNRYGNSIATNPPSPQFRPVAIAPFTSSHLPPLTPLDHILPALLQQCVCGIFHPPHTHTHTMCIAHIKLLVANYFCVS